MSIQFDPAITHKRNIFRLLAVVIVTSTLTLVGCDAGDEKVADEQSDASTLEPLPEEDSSQQEGDGSQMMERYPERTMPGSPGAGDTTATRAIARISPVGDGSVEGVISFSSDMSTVQISGQLAGLEPGKHGFHIHENGDCGGDNAEAAGGHFNPSGNPHGSPDDDADEHHAGDFGNIVANSEGMARVNFSDSEISLSEDANNVIGKAIVVHSGEDDLSTQPSGDAGNPVACGVIEIETDANTNSDAGQS